MKNKYAVTQFKDVEIDIGFMTINGEPVPGAATSFLSKAGTKAFPTKKSAAEFITAMTKDYGAGVVGPIEAI